MKSSAVIGGLAAALVLAGAAQAGQLYIFYWGKDGAATVDIDGTLHDVGTSNDYSEIVKNVYEGSHTVILHANGGTTRTDFTFSTANAAYPDDKDGPTWCIDQEDSGATMSDEDDCDGMIAYSLYGDDDDSEPASK